MTLLDVYDFPKSFWSTNHTGSHSYRLWEEDGYIHIELDLPGTNKEDIELKYDNSPSKQRFHIFVKEKIDNYIYPTRQIIPDLITAKLDLGVLKIKAQIEDSSKQIQIE